MSMKAETLARKYVEALEEVEEMKRGVRVAEEALRSLEGKLLERVDEGEGIRVDGRTIRSAARVRYKLLDEDGAIQWLKAKKLHRGIVRERIHSSTWDASVREWIEEGSLVLSELGELTEKITSFSIKVTKR